ncbi:helix-turn-helix domain-containing protein [Nocardioides cheoyonin]|uniref:helix-turn-helix domain-containing protein n=1 Tax=Nocardioides cheoyonin TaxID=3156615 RepID=UPI0032B3E2B9
MSADTTARPGLDPGPPPPSGRRLTSYDELGTRRHHLISERLRQRRRELGLTQKEVVARLRRMGVATTNKALSALEHGAGLDVSKLPEIARALECSLTYVVGLTDDPRSWEPDFEHWPGRRTRSTPAPAPTPAVSPPAPRAAPVVRREPVARPETNGRPGPAAECPPILGPLR